MQKDSALKYFLFKNKILDFIEFGFRLGIFPSYVGQAIHMATTDRKYLDHECLKKEHSLADEGEVFRSFMLGQQIKVFEESLKNPNTLQGDCNIILARCSNHQIVQSDSDKCSDDLKTLRDLVEAYIYMSLTSAEDLLKKSLIVCHLSSVCCYADEDGIFEGALDANINFSQYLKSTSDDLIENFEHFVETNLTKYNLIDWDYRGKSSQ